MAEKQMLRENYLKREPSNYSPGYFQSLNSELESKIENIKKKYDAERVQLQEKYPSHQKITSS